MLLLTNGRFYTQDLNIPQTDSLLIHAGRIEAIGAEARQLAQAMQRTEHVDLAGKTVWPGLIDAHIHLQYLGLSLELVNCETDTLAECLIRVQARNSVLKPDQWLLGHGWNQNNWAEGFGSKEALDAVSGGHPAYLTAKSYHAAWANTRALEMAGIKDHTPDPPDGKIGRDAAGHANGILYEAAMDLVAELIPEPESQELQAALLKAQSLLWQYGITAVHDFDRRSCFVALQELRAAQKLKLRVNKSIPMEDLPHAAALGLQSGLGDDLLRIGPVKLFADGALGPRSAAMLQPYENAPENSGMLFLDAGQVMAYGQTAVNSGLSLAIHAIGDRANHEILNGFERLRQFEKQTGLPNFRHRIEHVQVLHPQDYGRLAQLDIIASMQPIHATSDMLAADRYWGSRAAGAYAFQTLLQNRTHLAFGSDAPVESPNPFLGLHAAVTRRRVSGEPDPNGWYPQQRISLAQALQAFTTGAAFAAGLEKLQAKLTPGYFADLIVLEEDPYQLDPAALAQVKPVATMVAGEWVWHA